MKYVFLALSLLILLSSNSAAQSKMSGRVVEVTDGKTVVIEIAAGKLTAEIQYIDIPGLADPFSQTARLHLEKLVLGKSVEFTPQGIGKGRTFGVLYSGDIDIGAQMVRDGAAWQTEQSVSGQDADSDAAYKLHQRSAKAEMRGVWADPKFKPVVKAAEPENPSAQRQQDTAFVRSSDPGDDPKNETTYVKPNKTKSARSTNWGDVNPYLNNIGALANGYNAKTKTGFLGTSFLGVTESETAVGEQFSTAVEIAYVYKQEGAARKGDFVISVISKSQKMRFLTSNDLVIIADEKKIKVPKPQRSTWKEFEANGEGLVYKVPKSAIEAIAFGGDVVISVGGYLIKPAPGLQMILYNMLQAT